jgi:alanine racemase
MLPILGDSFKMLFLSLEWQSMNKLQCLDLWLTLKIQKKQWLQLLQQQQQQQTKSHQVHLSHPSGL